MEANQNSSRKLGLCPKVRPNTPLFYLSQDHKAIEKLLVIGTGLSNLEVAETLIMTSKVTCETLITKISQTK
jgi:hypothetical protein